MTSPQERDDSTPEITDGRAIALALAVVHHGMANLSGESVPASWQIVLKTSNNFLKWLSNNMPDEELNTRR